MAFLGEIEGCYANARDVGLSEASLSGGSTVPVNVWGFTEGLVVAAASSLEWQREKRIGPRADLTPDDIASVYPWPTFLEPDGLDCIVIGEGREHRRVLGVDHAIFDYGDGTEFDLMVLQRRTEELLALLHEVYPDIVKDERDLG